MSQRKTEIKFLIVLQTILGNSFQHFLMKQSIYIKICLKCKLTFFSDNDKNQSVTLGDNNHQKNMFKNMLNILSTYHQRYK